MLPAIGILLGFQLIGEIVTRATGAAIPGPVAGLALLALALVLRPQLATSVRPTVSVILANLSLLFVPAGVGVIGNLDVFADGGLALLVVLVVPTLLSMLAAVATFIAVERLTSRQAR